MAQLVDARARPRAARSSLLRLPGPAMPGSAASFGTSACCAGSQVELFTASELDARVDLARRARAASRRIAASPRRPPWPAP